MDTSLTKIKQNVFKLCSKLLSNEHNIDEDEDLFLLGLSSLDFLKLITSIEKTYNVNFDENILFNVNVTLNTINKISNYIYDYKD
ncbi:MAG: acyl carrier protein [Staphylococcus epidermidis]|jgi:acyl carrier protein|nr:acyl carrier protein [Veillonella sp.]MDU1612186.1 acyl carrier protein [Staphylococcus epidermidis]MDU1788513.1 acyl carrier protein [Streptococcus thermophilus]MDU3139438.1 acyl carrier protein [Staphylococcus lugdunensis]MDU3768884.1 acyl carrier protein [Cutibacterium granulosum]MDU3872475.1 acyl carrier protein [Staphylococcus warneri]MDU7038650.1 acyl carrier protein [Lactococcus lactis]